VGIRTGEEVPWRRDYSPSTTTPLDQSTRFHEAAEQIGVQSQLIVLEGVPHSFHLQPKQRDLRPDVLMFFDTHLKPH
jgi:dipeptidyl aminopeptidase/acylaminoacyl peptidase